jgi:hypothetical protein
VIPTIFCSFFGNGEFERRFETRYGAKLERRFLRLLCASHERMPFDTATLAGSLADAERRAEEMKESGQLRFYSTAITELVSDYRPHHNNGQLDRADNICRDDV